MPRMAPGQKHPDDIYMKQQRPRMGRRRRGRDGRAKQCRVKGDESSGRRHTGRFADGNPHRTGFGVWLVLGLLGMLLVYIGFLVVVAISAKKAPAVVAMPEATPTAIAVASVIPVEETPGPPAAESIDGELQQRIEAWTRSRDSLQRLRIAVKPEDQTRALDILRDRLVQTPDWLPLNQEFARRAFKAGLFAEALPVLLHVVDMDPSSMEMRTLLAQCLLRLRDYPAAERVAMWNLELDPYSNELQQIIADSMLARGQLENALPHLRVIAETTPLDLKLQNQYADALSRAGQYERAVMLYSRLVQQDPSHALSYYNFALCHTRQGRADGAVQVLRQAVEHLGHDFVKNWLGNPEFDPLRSSEAWQIWLQELNEVKP
jgi:Flp pilus assembly protein TadD